MQYYYLHRKVKHWFAINKKIDCKTNWYRLLQYHIQTSETHKSLLINGETCVHSSWAINILVRTLWNLKFKCTNILNIIQIYIVKLFKFNTIMCVTIFIFIENINLLKLIYIFSSLTSLHDIINIKFTKLIFIITQYNSCKIYTCIFFK